jgi:hypothetical protein
MQLFLIPTKRPALLMAQITWGLHSDTFLRAFWVQCLYLLNCPCTFYPNKLMPPAYKTYANRHTKYTIKLTISCDFHNFSVTGIKANTGRSMTTRATQSMIQDCSTPSENQPLFQWRAKIKNFSQLFNS